MKIKNLLSIPVMLLTLAIAGCNGGTGSTNSASTNNSTLSSHLSITGNDELLVTNAASSDITWGNNSLENILVGSKGLKAIKVTNKTNQSMTKLTLTTSKMPADILLDTSRTTCSVSGSLKASESCLYVFSYSPTADANEAGAFIANVYATILSGNELNGSINVNYSARVNPDAGTLAIKVDTKALNCNAATPCNGSIYVMNSKGVKVSSVINVTGNNDDNIYASKISNLNPNESYTVVATSINGFVPVYSPTQIVHVSINSTVTININYELSSTTFGKAIIRLPKVVPNYTDGLAVQVINTKTDDVVGAYSLKQGESRLIESLPISDASHSYVVKLVSGVADPVNGLFYSETSFAPLEIKGSSYQDLSIPMEKATSLSDVTLKIGGIDSPYRATVSFSDANNQYQYVDVYNQTNGTAVYKAKTGLNLNVQTQVNGTLIYEVNPINNKFTLNSNTDIAATFQKKSLPRLYVAHIHQQYNDDHDVTAAALEIRNCPISSDGNIGACTIIKNIPTVTFFSAAGVRLKVNPSQTMLYVVATGMQGVNKPDAVYFIKCPILADGNLGNCSNAEKSIESLPIANTRNYPEAIRLSNYIDDLDFNESGNTLFGTDENLFQIQVNPNGSLADTVKYFYNSKSGTYPREVFAFSFNKLDNSIIYSSDVGNVYNFNLNDETMNTIAQTSIGGRRFIASYSAINYAIKAYYSGGFDTQSLTRCLTSFVGKMNCAAYEVDDNASGDLDTYIDTSFGMVFNSEGNRAYFLGRGNVDLTNIESLPVTMASCLVKQDGDIVSCKQINAGFSIPTFFSHRKEFGFAYADK